MIQKRPILYAALSLAIGGSSFASAAERIPAELAAKRAGVVSQATPSPLNMIYTPVPPCRVFSAQAISRNQTETFQITGDAGFSGQGGPAAGCGVPAAAKAVSLNLTAAGASKAGIVRAYATGTTAPNTVVTNYAGGGRSTGAGIVGLGSNGRIAAFSDQSIKVAGDITGYFVPQLSAYILSSGAISDQTGRLVSSTKTATGTYTLTWDQNVTYCAVNVTPDYSAKYASSYTSGAVTYVYMFNSAGAAVDYYFNIHVSC